MLIDFSTIHEVKIPGFYGGEGVTAARMYADRHGKIMSGALEPGASIGLHAHEGSSEIVYILSGTGRALYDGGTERLATGVCHACPPGHTHSLINDGAEPLVFFAAVPEHHQTKEETA